MTTDDEQSGYNGEPGPDETDAYSQVKAIYYATT